MGTMKAAVYYGPLDLRVENVDIPEVGPKDILLKVEACGICGSDIHSYRTGAYIEKGQIMGHEFSGEVVKVGQDVKGIRVGERGAGLYSKLCGSCYWCQNKQYNLCTNLFKASLGYGLPGAFAEYVLIPNAKKNLSFFPVPSEMDKFTIATIEPVAVASYAVSESKPNEGDQVVVMGAGLIGNVMMQIFKAKKVDKVVVTEVSELRLNTAKQWGADEVINAMEEDVLARVKEIVGIGPYHFHEGAMADIVVDASGAPSAVEQSFEMVRSGGTIAFVGLPEKNASLDTTKIVHKAPKILGLLGGDFNSSVELLTARTVKTKDLVTHAYPIDHVTEAFEKQMKPNESVKVMIEF